MCGIAGFVDLSRGMPADRLAATIRRMATALRHRGPDDDGAWIEAEAGVALGHQRLSILDLSPAGHQPMESKSGRYVLSYNGEIYNFQELRAELEGKGVAFRGHCDTEVIVEAIAAWGLAATLPRLIGMFAFVLWDREARTLTLVRDRMGIKPLYWAHQNNLFLFASELKAFHAHPGFRAEVNRDSLTSFLRHNYIPAPHSIYRNTFKLLPGTMLTLCWGGKPELSTWWDLREIAGKALHDRPEFEEEEAREALDGILRDAVKRRMVADVPLGAFLSGGIDSSTVTALMQAQSEQPIRTFTIGFHEEAYDEAKDAKRVAGHLGTEHTELYVEPRDALEVIPKLPLIYDEPFADSSQIPTFLVSELTRQHVKVALSGDGGDELFAGYNRYFWAEALWRKLRLLPKPARGGMAMAIRALSPAQWDGIFGIVPPRLRPRLAGDKLHKLADVFALSSREALYRQLLTHWAEPASLVHGGKEPTGILWDAGVADEFPDFTERMQFLDSVTYLPDDILTKVDRASMRVGLEARVPLLDHRVVEFVWRLPGSMKVRKGEGKWLLRRVLDRYVPKALVERPKMGFGVPIDSWLRGPLRDWGEALLSERRLREEGFFDPEPIRQKWQEHLGGKRNWQYPLWDVLMFQAWLEQAGTSRK
ncbi:MAG: asparagine synthase (glutamine-hydrolyzing) [Alphaproteobacteria bacterium]|nr:asparagine synthase (glutamine-hydrolyzing) [Alphaproteobacteria bacterium]